MEVSIPLITSGLHLLLLRWMVGRCALPVSIPLITSGLHLLGIAPEQLDSRIRKRVSIPLITSGLHLHRNIFCPRTTFHACAVSIPLITSGLHLQIAEKYDIEGIVKFQSLLLRQVFIYHRGGPRETPRRTGKEFQSLLLRQVFIYLPNRRRFLLWWRRGFNPSYYVRSSSTEGRTTGAVEYSGSLCFNPSYYVRSSSTQTRLWLY